MSEGLTKPQQMLMWEIFAAGGIALQKDLQAADAAARAALVRSKMLKADKRGRSLQLELEDNGWRWIADSEPFPIAEGEKRVSAERRLLGSLIVSLKRYAADHETTLQDLFRAPPSAAAPELPAPKPSRRKAKASSADEPAVKRTRKTASKAETAARPSVEEEIRAAFFALAGRPPSGNVRLGALRAALAHLDRADLDRALLAMDRSEAASLINLDNPRDIAAEGDSGLTKGGRVMHLLWIDE